MYHHTIHFINMFIDFNAQWPQTLSAGLAPGPEGDTDLAKEEAVSVTA
jgi:hypothetical protein